MTSISLQYRINLNGNVRRELATPPSRGSKALVYRGVMGPSGTRVAIKIFRFGPPTDAKAIERVVREVFRWTRLQHPNILPIYGVATEFDFTMALVSEWQNHGNAAEYVRNSEIDPRPLLIGVAKALHYLHHQLPTPIIHGDLRGKNIFISADGRAVVADYGLSAVVDAEFDNNVAVSSPGGWSIRWMSPETMESFGEINIKDDVWAFGMTILELLTRKPPFYELQGLRAVITRIMQSPPDHPSDESTCSRMTDTWWEICLLCWKRDPLQRPTISEIIPKIYPT
ncbi:hypothetical protein ID866_9992 [Astraeus odoratus]|nr:hypothetical protein ID866_9992 [Astraeus odoratus]